MVRTVFALPDGTIAYVRPENEFRKQSTARRFLEIPTWNDGSPRAKRIQELAGKSQKVEVMELAKTEQGRQQLLSMGIKPHKGGEVVVSGGKVKKGYSYDRYVTVDLTENEAAELRSLMIGAAESFEPRLGNRSIAVARSGSRTVSIEDIGDENAPPFTEKLKIAKTNTLQKWAKLGGAYYSVVTAELDEMRCVSTSTDKKYGYRNADGSVKQGVSTDEIVHQMNKHAKQPFAMDRHFSMRDLIGKPMNPKLAAQFKALVAKGRGNDYLEMIRKLLVAGQTMKRENPNDPKSKFHMYSDGVHGTKKQKQSQRSSLPVSQHMSQLKTKPCEDCGLVPIKINDHVTNVSDAKNLKFFLNSIGFNIGDDNIVYLLHLEQFVERYGLTLDPTGSVITDADHEKVRSGEIDGTLGKCEYVISEATVGKLMGNYSPEDVDARFSDMLSRFNTKISVVLARNTSMTKDERAELRTELNKLWERVVAGRQVYRKDVFNIWEQNERVLRNVITLSLDELKVLLAGRQTITLTQRQ